MNENLPPIKKEEELIKETAKKVQQMLIESVLEITGAHMNLPVQERQVFEKVILKMGWDAAETSYEENARSIREYAVRTLRVRQRLTETAEGELMLISPRFRFH